MTHTLFGWAFASAVASGAALACSSPPLERAGTDQKTTTDIASSDIAQRALSGLRRFGLGAEMNVTYARSETSIVARPSTRAAAGVVLPETAHGTVRLRDASSTVEIAFRHRESNSSAAAEGARGWLVYPGGAAGNHDLFVRATPAGVEDFVVFETRPERPRLSYELDLGTAAGLRLVDNVLEFLDERGAPRLRVRRPYLIDRERQVHAARLALIGCAFDSDPRAPWGRALVTPGARHCELEVSWEQANVAYPVALDPAWSTTDSMSDARVNHTSTTLEDGRALLVGGEGLAVQSAEIYDPASGTFATTGTLNIGRYVHAAARLTGNYAGKVLAMGGRDQMLSAEIYDPKTGKWTLTGPLNIPHHDLTAVVLDDGRVFMAGAGANLKVAEIYDPALDEWTQVAPMTFERGVPTVTLLASGLVLIAGGGNSGTSTKKTELYDPKDNTWSDGGDLTYARNDAASVRLPNDKVLIAGGSVPGLGIVQAELYDPTLKQWSATGSLTIGRSGRGVRQLPLLAGGRVLFPGAGPDNKSAEIYDTSAGVWLPAGTMSLARELHSANVLGDGTVLVAGGIGNPGGTRAEAEVFELLANGDACTAAGECDSGFCADGVCCESACTGVCLSCRAADQNGGSNGTCGPVKANADPANDCKDDGTPSCGLNGLCDGAGACASYAESVCTAQPCTGNTHCASGHCEDGICCDAACGECQACTAAKKGFGVDGICEAVSADADPDDECSAGPNYPKSCLADGACDGQGACRTFGKDTVSCGATQCISGNAVGLLCNGAGSCVQATRGCDPYVCRDDSCLQACQTDNDCAEGAFCTTNGTCSPKSADGSSCSLGKECASGFCVDGVCCDQACNGQCEACDVDPNVGRCAPVRGEPVGERPSCRSDDSECGGVCDGVNRAACDFPAAGKACGEISCSAGSETRSSCNGSGECVAEERDCSPFTCDAEACRDSCSDDDACAPGFGCDATSGECLPSSGRCLADGMTLETSTGDVKNCSPYRCEAGECSDPCVASSDCVSGFVCDQGSCVSLGDTESADDAGCGCRLATSTRSPPHYRFAALLLLGLGLRRMRRAGRRPLPLARVLSLSLIAASCSSRTSAPDPVTNPPEPPAALTLARQQFPTSGLCAAPAAQPARSRVRVTLASSSRQPTRLEDTRSGVAAGFALSEVAERPARLVGATASYEAVRPGADWFQVVTETGVEDFVRLTTPPPQPKLQYRIEVGSARGLRLVANVLEFLDTSGVPRLRAVAPFLIDASGAKRQLSLALSGCAFDSDLRAPHGRPPVPPGADHCALHLSWDAQGLVYPILIDPAWTSTGNMVLARRQHMAALLPSGRVLVNGGELPGLGLENKPAEIYDPSSGTWTSTEATQAARGWHALTPLPSGKVLAVGSRGHAICELYDETTGHWTLTGSLGNARAVRGRALRLADGRVLVAGGSMFGSDRSAELYDETTGKWTLAGTMAESRQVNAMVELEDGRVLVAGGCHPIDAVARSSAELWDPKTLSFTPTDPLSTPRCGVHGVRLSDGRVLVASGFREPSLLEEQPTTEIFNPKDETWSAGPTLNQARYEYSAHALNDGRILIAGSCTVPGSSTSELLDTAASAFAPAGSLPLGGRCDHSSTLLADGRVLIAGGGNIHKSSIVWGPVPNGGSCTLDAECLSGSCVDGMCCSEPCDGSCESCVGSQTGAANGVCAEISQGLDPRGECDACLACDGKGDCGSVAAGSDPKNDCQDSGSPACAEDGACDGAGNCRMYEASAGCTPTPCTNGSQCSSGACADGVCCNDVCSGTCEACSAAKKGFGVDGTCEPSSADTDPDDECEQGPNYPTSCLSDGMCDGAGACRQFAKDTVSCGNTQCSAGSAVGLLCNGAGQCLNASRSCEPYVCRDDSCLQGCADDNDCLSSAYCSSQDACLTKRAIGSTCSAGKECSSGYCVDGLCCDQACSGRCEACDESPNEGTCVPIVGEPHGERAACDSDGSECGGACDGVDRASCAFPPTGESCGSKSCDTDAETLSSCNGSGSCMPEERACSPFACGDDACLESCSDSADCAQGFGCDTATGACLPRSGRCLADGTTLETSTGEVKSCSPYRCDAGECSDPCVASSDCVSGFVCDEGKCVALGESDPGDDGGCGCRVTPAGHGHAAYLLALGLALSLRARRRRVYSDRTR